jgi:hypothetical protein
MNFKTVCWLVSIALIFSSIWVAVANDAPHVPAKLVVSKNAPLQVEHQDGREQRGRESDQLKRLELTTANESNFSKSVAMDAVAGAQSATLAPTVSAPAASALAVPERGSVAVEKTSKQDSRGPDTIAQNTVAVDRPFDRESSEFAAIMADKNAAMNALHGKQAAQALLQPEAVPAQMPSNRKAPL